ncbi:MAG TPA: YraN family protein [Myxococcota bacterium]|jgi:putative endonuclease|nr:YraN family protein [Myxococcota bacterium]
MDDRTTLGTRAEAVVADLLRARGCAIVARNARDPTGELDLVARRDRQVLVVEVRSRRGAGFDDALDSIGGDKRRRVRRMAERWLSGRPVDYDEVRFCVAAVAWEGDEPRVRWIEDAF